MKLAQDRNVVTLRDVACSVVEWCSFVVFVPAVLVIVGSVAVASKLADLLMGPQREGAD